MPPRAPTIADLRLKSCFICLEEESIDDPPESRRTWIHPCKCSLLAHESCLLHWMRSSPSSTATTSSSSFPAAVCPQCKIPYTLVVRNQRLWTAVGAVEDALGLAGRLTAGAMLGTMSMSVASFVYAPMTLYGAAAFKAFVGTPAYDAFLTNDIDAWPASAWVNLPLIPLTLLLSPFHLPYIPSPTLALLHLASDLAGASAFLAALRRGGSDNLIIAPDAQALWPPDPLLCSIVLFPLVRKAYTALRERVYQSIALHALQAYVAIDRPYPVFDPQDHHLPRVPAHRRLDTEDDNNDDDDDDDRQREDAPVPAQHGQELPLRLTLKRVQRIGGMALDALAMPFVAGFMGVGLLRLSRHSTLLCSFLAVAPPAVTAKTLGERMAKEGFWSLLSGILANRRALAVHEPVWWRSAVGYGVFVLGRDILAAIQSHLYYRRALDVSFESRPYTDEDRDALGMNMALMQGVRAGGGLRDGFETDDSEE